MRSRRLALSLICLFSCTVVSLAADKPAPTNSAQTIESTIDHWIDLRLKESGIAIAPQADDATFIRRVTLDLVGRIPTMPETKAYLESTDPSKKTQLIDRLMASPGFVRHQASMFEAMLTPGNLRNGSNGLREYFVKALGENRSWNQMFREIMLPDDNNAKIKGSSDFLKARVSDLDRLTNDVSVTFFGVNVSCAQCHDHPLVQDWKQDHFYGMKAFLSRTVDNGGILIEREFGLVKFKPTKGPERQAKMMFLTGTSFDAPNTKEPSKDEEKKEREALEMHKKNKTVPPPPSFSARAKLVEIALQPKEAEFFSKSIVNRMWHRFVGYGFVMPLDQMHSENKPSHPELLQWLAQDTAEHQYDLRRLTRGIVLSKAYARSSKWTGDTTPPPQLFAVGRVRPLTPMQLATSLKLGTTDPKSFENLKSDEFEKRIEAIENSARGFASAIAAPTDDFQISVTEALLFSNNGRIIQEYLTDSADKLLGRVKTEKELAPNIEMIVRSVLCRPASQDEVRALSDYIGQRNDRLGEAYRQVVWALITGAEFRFNH